MAIKKCRECGKEVSTEAKSCPHCGCPKPIKGLSIWSMLAAFVVIGLIASTCSGPDKKEADKDGAPLPTKATEPQKKSCAQEDIQCVGEENIITAHVYCKDKVERLTTRAVKWTDEGMFEQKFSRFKWADKPGGVIRYFGDKAQFQNGYGAWINVIYSCDVQPGVKAAIDAALVGEGRLPK